MDLVTSPSGLGFAQEVSIDDILNRRLSYDGYGNYIFDRETTEKIYNEKIKLHNINAYTFLLYFNS